MSKEEREETFNSIIKFVSEGNSLKESCDKARLDKSTFYRWIKDDKEKSDMYAHAREDRADLLFEEILEIADESAKDIYEDKDGNKKVDHESIQRSRLRVEARKWVLSKMQPKKYGDKVDLTSDGDKITTNILNLGNGTPPKDEPTT